MITKGWVQMTRHTIFLEEHVSSCFCNMRSIREHGLVSHLHFCMLERGFKIQFYNLAKYFSGCE